MILHTDTETYLDLIRATAKRSGLPAVYIEKDYWVTLALKRLHESDYKNDIVFKGGTALSKAHRVIERFSEDIDLAVRDKTIGDSRRKRLLKRTEQAVTQDLNHQIGHPLESKHGRFRKTVHTFPMQIDTNELGQVAEVIVVEINALTDPEPACAMPIASLVHDFSNADDRPGLIEKFELEPFDLLVLNVERTLCEKVMGLIRASYEKDSTTYFRDRIRHFYDLVMILRHPTYQSFVASDAFVQTLDKVIAADRDSMPKASAWLDPPLLDARVFTKTTDLWDTIKDELHGDFARMVYGGNMPSDDEVLRTVNMIKAGLSDTAERK